MTEAPRIAVDTGGTFTDLVSWADGQLRTYKLPSTPADPSLAIVQGIGHWYQDVSAVEVVHGSTVGTNALLERRGAKTALVTTHGFEDVLELGRGHRQELYSLYQPPRRVLLPTELRLGVRERVLFDGSILESLPSEELDRLGQELQQIEGLEAVAICLLHSYANPDHESQVEEFLSPLGYFVSRSSRILPEYREFERTATTVVNAYLGPIMARYLRRLEEQLPVRRLRVMHSGGGLMSCDQAAQYAGRTVLSGPAGGVLGALRAARRVGLEKVISFDMGGTSTDVALLNNGLATTSEQEVDGLPIRFPVLDIETVGAGGGSIARIDAGGALEVGPASAGADPGPICYGRGGEAVTVTDANLYLGRLVPESFLGGRMRLDSSTSRQAIEALAAEAQVEPAALAEGILTVAQARMAKAIRVISMERGYDPRDYTLVAFGGAGPLHACSLAAAIGMRSVLIPSHPGILSAWGMLGSDVVHDESQAWLTPWNEEAARELTDRLAHLGQRAQEVLQAEGYSPTEIRLEARADLRYRGQSFELSIPVTETLAQDFHRAHESRYGHAHPDWPIEIVTLRLRAIGPGELTEPPLESEVPGDASQASLGRGIYDRERLTPGDQVDGPAVIVEMSATTYLPPDWHMRVDGAGNLRVER